MPRPVLEELRRLQQSRTLIPISLSDWDNYNGNDGIRGTIWINVPGLGLPMLECFMPMEAILHPKIRNAYAKRDRFVPDEWVLFGSIATQIPNNPSQLSALVLSEKQAADRLQPGDRVKMTVTRVDGNNVHLVTTPTPHPDNFVKPAQPKGSPTIFGWSSIEVMQSTPQIGSSIEVVIDRVFDDTPMTDPPGGRIVWVKRA